MKRIISFLAMVVLVLILVGCDKNKVDITGPSTVEVGQTILLEATADYDDPVFEWSSEDDSIAIVEDGYVTGVKVGTVNIVATCDKDVSAKHSIEVVEASLSEYTPAQLRNLLTALRDEYSSSKNGHVIIAAVAGTKELEAELIYNFGTDEIESLMYTLSEDDTAHVYVKDGYSYMMINDVKAKSLMTETEYHMIMENYGFDRFVKEAAGFYDEPEFYNALSFSKKEAGVLVYNLNLADYDGIQFKTEGKDAIRLEVHFNNNNIEEVVVFVTAGTDESAVGVRYLGTTAQDITYPSDLDSYPEQ